MAGARTGVLSTVQNAPYRLEWTPLSVSSDQHEMLYASSSESFESRDPATGEIVAEVQSSTSEDVDEAVARARQIADRGVPWTSNPELRARVLHRFAESLRGEREALAQLLTREQGKPISESRLEITKAANLFDFYGGLCRAIAGRALSLSESAHGIVTYQPCGVVGIIVPWNCPLIILARALAPAWAAGNACVVKPASLTPAITAAALSLLSSEPELPRGALAVIHGEGSVIGSALVGNPGVDMISFTGASATGVQVMKSAADGLKKVCLELGGKSPNIVFADANLPKAVAGAQNAIFATSGQSCTAGSRLLVEESVYDEFVSSLVAATRTLRVGDGLNPATDVGPLVSEHQKDVVLDYIRLAAAEAHVLVGGLDAATEIRGPGFFVPPTIVADVPPLSRLLRDEIFGPVLTVQPFASESDAVRLANDTEYGLAAGIWTSDLDRAFRVGRQIDAGTVWINTYHHYYPEAEGGGFKRSGIGRQQGEAGLYEYLEMKHLNFDTAPMP